MVSNERSGVRARPRLVAALLATAFLTSYTPAVAHAPAAAPALTARWTSSWLVTQAYQFIEGSFTVSGGGQQTIVVHLDGARFLALPPGCQGSSTVNMRSRISTAVDTLHCWLGSGRDGATTVAFSGLVVAPPGQSVRGTVQVQGGGPTAELPARLTTAGTPPAPGLMRLVSSPDFLNADVGNLAKGPARWSRKRSGTENSINGSYRRALDTVLDDWATLSPDAVLVAGDLVDGWWGLDRSKSGNFGQVGTLAESKQALARAAKTYYPQWLKRFTQRGLDVLPAMGDHEFGDDPWRRKKRERARAFEKQFVDHFGHLPGKVAKQVSRPAGVHHGSAWAIRPRPEVQLVTLNVFDITPERDRVRLDRAQMKWLRQVLEDAQRDGVQWVIVQGHTPIAGPVRTRASSGLRYEGGTSSELWKVFQKYGVDLYLAGEVHDVTSVEQDGITQITHGGIFSFGLTNYLVVDISKDYAYITLRDYDFEADEAPDGSRLWETRPAGMPKRLKIKPDPFTIGTGVLLPNGDLTRQSGVLKRPGR